MTGDQSLLSADHLGVFYGPAQALFDVSIHIQPGEAVALLGVNGAGKSTLARTLCGLVAPRSGSVRFDGQDCTRWSPYRVRRAGIIYLPEGRGIFPGLTVMDNLKMAVTVSRSGGRGPALDSAFEMFPVLSSRRGQLAGSLSGGEQQMLSLARAVAGSPKLVIADEMSLGLAPKMVDVVFESLNRMRAAGVAIVLIEQFIHRALAFADGALLLQRGKIAWDGRADEAKQEVLARYLGTGGALR